jgi:hypothetical protein
MSALIPTVKAEKEDEKSTNVGRFLARRGILLIKEFRDMSAVKGEYGGKVSVSTLILSSAQTTRGDVQYGVKLEHTDEDGDIRGSGFLDYDEIAELIGAFDFIHSVANKMVGQQRDYTEVTYQTKRQPEVWILPVGWPTTGVHRCRRIRTVTIHFSLKATKPEVVYRGGETALNESRS